MPKIKFINFQKKGRKKERKKRKKIEEKKMSNLHENWKFFKIVIIGLHIFLLTDAAPNLSQKSFNDEFNNPIISLLCPTNEPCWNSLSDSSYIFEEAEMQEPR